MSGSLGDLVITLSADIARFQEDMGKANRVTQDSMKKMADDVAGSISGVTGQFSAMAATIGSIAGTALAVFAGGKMFKDMIDSTKTWNGEVMSLSRTLGMSVAEASAYNVALRIAGVDQDTATAATAKLTKTIATNEAAFASHGIVIRDVSTGKLLPMTQIIGNTFDALGKLNTGVSRNSAAMELFGKSWVQLQGMAKITNPLLAESRQLSEDLGLTLNGQTSSAVKNYGMEMNKLKLVHEGFKVSIGREVIGPLGELEAAFTKALVKGGALRDTIRFMAHPIDFTQRQASFITHPGDRYPMPERPSAKGADYDPAQSAEAQAKAAREAAAAERRAAAELQLWASAHDKYLAYQKAFAAEQTELVKVGVASDLAVLQNGYDLGIVDLQAYLRQKHDMTAKSISDEIVLKKAEVGKYADAAEESQGKTDAKGAAAYHEALIKLADAKKELIALQGKLEQAEISGGAESVKLTTDQVRGFREQAAALADLQNDFVKAAAIRRGLDESSDAHQKLITEAMTGNADAEAAYWAAEVQDQNRSAEAGFRQGEQYKQLGIQIMELAGQYEKAAKARKDLMNADPKFKLLPKEVQDQKNQIADEGISEGKAQDQQDPLSMTRQRLQAIGGSGLVSQAFETGIQHQTALDKLKADHDAGLVSEKAYTDKMLQINELYNDQKLSMAESAASQLTDIIAGQFQNSMGVQLAALAIQEAISVSQIMMSAEVAKMGVMAAYAAVPGGLAIAEGQVAMIDSMEAISIGIAAASGVAKAASIVSGKREAGGPVTGGETYLVGEKGPELFTPGASGAITPNHALGGGGVNVTQHISIDARGADPGSEQRLQLALKQNKEQTKAEIMDSMNRGGKWALASGRLK